MKNLHKYLKMAGMSLGIGIVLGALAALVHAF
jgi:hypothetical protein